MAQRSVLRRIAASTAIAFALFLALWTAAMAFWLTSSAAEALRAEASRLATEVSDALAPMVWNLDDTQILTYLDTKVRDPDLLAIRVTTTPQGDAWAAPRTLRRAPTPWMTVDHPVTYQGHDLGSVSLDLTLEPRHRQTLATILGLVLSQALLFLALSAAVVVTWRQVSGRLKSMVAVVEEFSGRGGPGRMTVEADDELGVLARGFNLLADRVSATTRSMEAEIQERTERLIESEKLALVGTLVAGVAHEINTPVGNGITICSWLRSRTKELSTLEAPDASALKLYFDDIESSLAILQSGLDRTSDLIRSFKKIGADQLIDERQQVDAAELLQEIVTSLQPTLKRFPHHIETQCPPGVRLETHPGALFQVLTNLILNAHTHAFGAQQEGTIRLVLDPLPTPNDEVRLVVADDGCGMAPEVSSRIFEPFFTTKRLEGGTGLGLSIVQKLVRTLGGVIEIETVVGQGSTFTITLPRVAPVSS